MGDFMLCKLIEGFPNYRIYSDGNIETIKVGKFLKPWIHKPGYYDIQLTSNKLTKPFKLHRLVAQTFILNPENKPCVNHKQWRIN